MLACSFSRTRDAAGSSSSKPLNRRLWRRRRLLCRRRRPCSDLDRDDGSRDRDRWRLRECSTCAVRGAQLLVPVPAPAPDDVGANPPPESLDARRSPGRVGRVGWQQRQYTTRSRVKLWRGRVVPHACIGGTAAPPHHRRTGVPSDGRARGGGERRGDDDRDRVPRYDVDRRRPPAPAITDSDVGGRCIRSSCSASSGSSSAGAVGSEP